MKANDDLFRIEHIIDSIGKIEELTRILHSFDNFEHKWIERDALIRNFEIIGEASNHISQQIKDKYTDVAWNEMRGMRNFISHEYFGLQLDSVWHTAINDIPMLKEQIKKSLLTYAEDVVSASAVVFQKKKTMLGVNPPLPVVFKKENNVGR